MTIDAPETPKGYLVGIYDFSGKQILPPVYNDVQSANSQDEKKLKERFGAPLYWVGKSGRYRLVTDGNVPVTDWFDSIEAYIEALSRNEIVFLNSSAKLDEQLAPEAKEQQLDDDRYGSSSNTDDNGQ